MIRGSIITFFLLLTPTLVLAQNGGSLYTPGAHRYGFTSLVKREQEHLGTKQSMEITTIQQVSLQLARKARDTLSFDVTLDSSSSTASNGAELPNLNGLKGVGIKGTLSPLGKVYAFAPKVALDDELVKQIQTGMSRMLPVFPKGVSVGTSWVDTNVTSVNTGGNDLRTTTIVTSTVLPDTTYDGQPAIRVQRKFAQKMTGKGTQLGQTMEFDGTGDGSGTYYVSRAGVFLGSTETTSSTMTLTLQPSGMSIPVKQSVTSTVQRLPAR
ncbi:MAG TPA: hypothetical protein VJ672_16365 [Gemmatimonadaceae bacterium]|nr:hypothetical protein [Gemmatimonadaceae bacterium]